MPPHLLRHPSWIALATFLTALPLGASLLLSERAAAAPESITCTNVSSRRVISVVRKSDAPLPCSVRYQKEPDGTDETPWRARRDPNYCTRQVNHLAQFLVSVGWICDPEPEPEGEAPAFVVPPAPDVAIDVAAPPPIPIAAPVVDARPPVAAPQKAAPTTTDPPQTQQLRARRWIFARDKARIAADPRLRFYSSRFGVETVAGALEIEAFDLNGDGAPEVFLRITLDGACGEAPCRWRLYTIAPGLRLASLGLRAVREWRLLPTSTAGYRDLWLAADDPEGDEMIARFVGSTGMYQLEAAPAQAALPEVSGGNLLPQ